MIRVRSGVEEGLWPLATQYSSRRPANDDAAVRRGNPSDEILDYVAANDIDLVAMGTHGREYEQNMLGSVSQRVVSACQVPVLTVKIDGE